MSNLHINSSTNAHPNPAAISAKTCNVCNATKNLQYFYKVGKGSKYFSSACKQCYNITTLNKYAARAVGRRRTKIELDAELRGRIQEQLDEGLGVYTIAKEEGISGLAIKKAISAGILTSA